ncbi:YfiR family protein [Acinetobacter indicus]|uniref:YfiR family protein n=1 Tax=Acinetobacter indicus TaxID=756892 RepID=UPI001D1749DD|nr:YfiR family protein [Acinetobacter indicus]
MSQLQLDDLKQTSCQVIVFSNLSPREEQNILNSTVRYPALSISTTNPAYELGSVFCLYQKKNQQYSFKVNMQSLTQSQVHIAPGYYYWVKTGA